MDQDFSLSQRNSNRKGIDFLKNLIRNTPVLGPFLVRLRRQFNKVSSSSEYWEQRYKSGGNSGAGSYDRLAEFKADFLNEFVEQHQIRSVIEFGSGDGAQLKRAKYPTYMGVDISMSAVERCRRLFAGDPSKQFFQLGPETAGLTAELALSLDVVYHLIEDSVFDAYMKRLFESATRFVIVYSNNIDEPWSGTHVRHRQFTRWIEAHRSDWRLLSTVKNAYPYNEEDPNPTSGSDFYVFEPR